jgi:hypothetical protein
MAAVAMRGDLSGARVGGRETGLAGGQECAVDRRERGKESEGEALPVTLGLYPVG